MTELNEYLVYEKYIDKRTKEKVIAVKGKSLIDMCIRGGNSFLTFMGKIIKFTEESQRILLSRDCFSLEFIEIEIDEEVVHKEDMVVCFNDGTIDIFAHDIFTEYFEKTFGKEDIKISRRGILRYAENKYLNLNAVSHIKFLEEGIIIENGVFQKGFEKSKTEHYDKIKELIKNYVEE